MTNKNKQKRSKEAKEVQDQKRQVLQEKAANAKMVEASTMPEVKPTHFSKGQLSAVMLVGVGISKLINIGKSIRMGEEPTKLCTQYFQDEAVCTNDGVNTFLRFKYMLSIQVLFTVMAVVLQCWQTDDVLIRYTGSLLVSPVFATAFALVLNSTILNQQSVWFRDVIMAFILTAVTMPPKTHIPFVTGKKESNKSFQSLSLMIFCCFALYDMFEWGSTLMQSGAQGVASAFLTPSFLSTLPGEASPALAVVTQFYLVDKLTIAASIFFAWYYLKEGHHRVSVYF